MRKTKTIYNKDYLKQLEIFMNEINPKPSESEREKLKQEYLKKRKEGN